MATIMKVAVLGGVLLVLTTMFGASAFTTAAIERDVSVTVQSDENGLLALTDGTSGPLIYGTSDEKLAIDLAAAVSGTGPNLDAYFSFGDKARYTADDTWDTNDYAFSITNNDGEAHTVALAYTVATDDVDTDANIKFLVYAADGELEATLTDENAASTASLPFTVGETKYVVMILETPDGENAVGTSYDGTLSLTVGSPPENDQHR